MNTHYDGLPQAVDRLIAEKDVVLPESGVTFDFTLPESFSVYDQLPLIQQMGVAQQVIRVGANVSALSGERPGGRALSMQIPSIVPGLPSRELRDVGFDQHPAVLPGTLFANPRVSYRDVGAQRSSGVEFFQRLRGSVLVEEVVAIDGARRLTLAGRYGSVDPRALEIFYTVSKIAGTLLAGYYDRVALGRTVVRDCSKK